MIALGSTADFAFRDRWSDHDFWVITQPGREEFYVESADWLPFADQILLTARRGDHCRTALYRTAHKVDFAAHTRETAMAHGRIERYSVLLDRGGISALAQSVREASRAARMEEVARPGTLSDLAMLCWTFHQRQQRGEWLAAHKYLTSGVELLLDLLQAFTREEEDSRTDFLDPTRRMERLQPELAAELQKILINADATSGSALLRIAERELSAVATDLEWEQSDMVAWWIENPEDTTGPPPPPAKPKPSDTPSE